MKTKIIFLCIASFFIYTYTLINKVPQYVDNDKKEEVVKKINCKSILTVKECINNLKFKEVGTIKKELRFKGYTKQELENLLGQEEQIINKKYNINQKINKFSSVLFVILLILSLTIKRKK